MLDLLEYETPSLVPLAYASDASVAKCHVLGVPIATTTNQEVIEQINLWIATSERPRLVTFANVHMLVEARLRPRFQAILERMDLNCPDGAPVFWMAKQLGRTAEKFSGPDFMPMFCEQSVGLGHRHFIYGGAEGVASQVARVLHVRCLGIQLVGHYTPPFRDLTEAEADEVVEHINACAPDVVWVSLGCPRQEWWLHEIGPRLNAKVVFAVGQATDIIAGRRSRAPLLMSKIGLEWLYRLGCEPGRLWKRYLVTNSLFLLLLLQNSLAARLGGAERLESDPDPTESGLFTRQRTDA